MRTCLCSNVQQGLERLPSYVPNIDYAASRLRTSFRPRHVTELLGAHAPSPLLRSVVVQLWMTWRPSGRTSVSPVQTARMSFAPTHCLKGSNLSGPLASSARRDRPHLAAPRRAHLWHPRAPPAWSA